MTIVFKVYFVKLPNTQRVDVGYRTKYANQIYL